MITLADKVLACYYSNIPCLIWGDPGLGKSATVEFIAKELKIHLETIISSIRGPEDFLGLPLRVDNSVVYVPPKWATNFEGKESGIVFFDEISTCTPNIQAALLNIVLNGKVGEYELPKRVYRLAASNFTNCFGNNELNPALGNRFVHLIQKPDHSLFTSMLRNDFKYSLDCVVLNNEEKRKEAYNKYKESIIAFINETGNESLMKFPNEVNEPLDYAFPSPRSWVNLLNILSTVGNSPEELVNSLIIGCIGKQMGNLFITHLNSFIDRKFRLLEHINDYKDTFKIEEIEYDELVLILEELINHLLGSETTDHDMLTFFKTKFENAGYSTLFSSKVGDIDKKRSDFKELTTKILTGKYKSDYTEEYIDGTTGIKAVYSYYTNKDTTYSITKE